LGVGTGVTAFGSRNRAGGGQKKTSPIGKGGAFARSFKNIVFYPTAGDAGFCPGAVRIIATPGIVRWIYRLAGSC